MLMRQDLSRCHLSSAFRYWLLHFLRHRAGCPVEMLAISCWP